VNEAAEGILSIATNNMIDATQEILIGQGFDPRDFTLMSFGGGGGIFAASIARGMSISRLLIPQNPGVFSAQGMLTMNLVHTYAQALGRDFDRLDVGELERIYQEIERTALKTLMNEGMTEDSIQFLRSIDICYEGQRYYIDTPAPNGHMADTEKFKSNIADTFRNLYQARYGHLIEAPLKTINVRLKAIGHIEEIPLQQNRRKARMPPDAFKKPRPLFMEGQWREVAVFERSELLCGNTIEGPALIEEPFHVTVLLAGQNLRVDRWGNLVIRNGGAR
jgi:N-methylhydantoinase A